MSSVNISKFGTTGSKSLTVDYGLSNEIRSRIQADMKHDTELKTQSDFDSSVTQQVIVVNASINTEINDSKNAITAEANERKTAIDTETNERKIAIEAISDTLAGIGIISADVITVSNNISIVSNNLNTEITNRSNADIQLQNNIDNLEGIYLKKYPIAI